MLAACGASGGMLHSAGGSYLCACSSIAGLLLLPGAPSIDSAAARHMGSRGGADSTALLLAMGSTPAAADRLQLWRDGDADRRYLKGRRGVPGVVSKGRPGL